MKTLLVIHGKSHLKARARTTWESFALRHKLPLDVIETTHAGHAQLLAENAAGCDLIIACGGDGTNHEVVNGLMRIKPEERPVMTTIAAGSGNDFARFRAPKTPENILQIWQSKAWEAVPLLELTMKGQRQYALNMSTAGIGAEIARKVNKRKYSMPPTLNYSTAILHWLVRYRAPDIEVSIDGQCFNAVKRPFLLAMGNGRYAGNGLGLCPQAALVENECALTIIGNVDVIDFLRYQRTLKRCEKIDDPRVHYLSASTIGFKVKAGLFSIEADGEFIAQLKAGDAVTYKKTASQLSFI